MSSLEAPATPDITFHLRKQELHLRGPLHVKNALAQLGLPLESYLVVREGELLVESDLLRNGDVIKLVATISGG